MTFYLFRQRGQALHFSLRKRSSSSKRGERCLWKYSPFSKEQIYLICYIKEGIFPKRNIQIKMKSLTVADVAAESRGNMPPQAMIMLSITWEMRWMVLCTNMTLSLLFTKSITVFVEWLSKTQKRVSWKYFQKTAFFFFFNSILVCLFTKKNKQIVSKGQQISP